MIKMKIKVFYFAAIKDIVGIDSETIDFESPIDTDNLKLLLSEKYPSAGQYFKNSRIAVNYEYFTNKTLKNGDEVAFILPVSGG